MCCIWWLWQMKVEQTSETAPFTEVPLVEKVTKMEMITAGVMGARGKTEWLKTSLLFLARWPPKTPHKNPNQLAVLFFQNNNNKIFINNINKNKKQNKCNKKQTQSQTSSCDYYLYFYSNNFVFIKIMTRFQNFE